MSAPQRPDETAEAMPHSPWRRRAPYVAAGVAGMVTGAAILALTQWVIDRENGALKSMVATAEVEEPAARPAKRRESVEGCMTSRQYNHLQRLPPYGVVKPSSELAKKFKRDGGP